MATWPWGLAYVESDLTGLRIISRFQVPHMAMLPANHPLASRQGPLQLSELSHERIIALLGVTAEVINRRRIGVKQSSPIIVETSYAAASLASAFDAVAIVDPFSAQWFMRHGSMTAHEVVDLAPYDVALFEPLGARVPRLSRRFQALLSEEIESVAVGVRQS